MSDFAIIDSSGRLLMLEQWISVQRLLQRSIFAKALLALAIVLLITAFSLPSNSKLELIQERLPLPQEPLVLEPELIEDKAPEIQHWLNVKVKRGDTLAQLLGDRRVSYGDVMALLAVNEQTAKLADLKAGEVFKLAQTQDYPLHALSYDLDTTHRLQVRQDENGLRAYVEEIPLQHEILEAKGVIQDSLFAAGKSAGLSDTLVMQLAEIFGWDVDFVLDIRGGDQFSLIYQQSWKEGQKLKDGPILAAEFINQGKVIQAVRYKRADGTESYFSPAGRNMRKAFLKTPVDFTRISSRFTYARKHPVLKGVTRPHRGVDYAAPRGTPVKVTGDGKVIHVGRNRGYGKHIIVQHGGKYKTLYAHLNAYRKGMKRGKTVQQGQVIGYVGMTGLASGPHLHYEFRVNDVHKNPLKVKFPAAEPLPEHEMQAFLSVASPLIGRLSILHEDQQIAQK